MPKKSGKGAKRTSRRANERLLSRRKEYDSLSETKKQGRRRPGSLSGRK